MLNGLRISWKVGQLMALRKQRCLLDIREKKIGRELKALQEKKNKKPKA